MSDCKCPSDALIALTDCVRCQICGDYKGFDDLILHIAELENPWVSVDGAENMPLGEWLGLCEDGERHVVRISEISNGMLANVGGCFHFDREKVVAYAPLPEPPK